MPSSILARFKRSPSESSTTAADGPTPNLSTSSPSNNSNRSPFRRNNASLKSTPEPASTQQQQVYIETPISPTAHSQSDSGSHFIEEFDEAALNQQDLFNNKGSRPRGYTAPALGTPKLTLTADGSSSPVSFGSSPHSERTSSLRAGIRKQPSKERLGLGIETVSESEEESSHGSPTPRFDTTSISPSTNISMMSAPADAVSIASAPPTSGLRTGRSRADSTASNELRNVKAGLAFGAKASGSASLKIPNEKKSKKHRRLSTSSHGIAAALAKGGIALAHGHTSLPNSEPLLSGVVVNNKSAPSSGRRSRSKRNPYLRSSHRPDGDGSDAGLDFDDDEDDDDDDDDDGSDLEGLLPVTGFAVASNRRNAEFHSMFPAVDEGDYLIEDYGCALSKDILVQGRLYVSENHVCFHANIFGWVTDIVLPFTEIRTIERKMTALVIPNAIGISTAEKNYTFATFISRDTTFDVLMNIWRLCNPDAVMTAASHERPRSRAASVSAIGGDLKGGGLLAGGDIATAGKGHAKTQCSCGKEGKHFSETALDTIFPSTPEKTYNLMFNSVWLKDFMSNDQKLKEIESSDWKPSPDTKILNRSTSYIKPLNGSIGPKQTKCHIVDEQLHCDCDDYIVMLTTTKTPDVPSGGVFSVKTKTCFTWAGSGSTRVLVTTQVEWTGKSWVKGIIDKSAIEGQKHYHNDLEKGMRGYMKEHPTEFHVAGVKDLNEITSEGDKEELSAAEEYAAETRRKRQNQDLSALQGALDSVLSGFKAIFTGFLTAVESIADLLNLGDEGGKVVILGMIIGILVISNIYTYVAYKPKSSESRRLKRLGWDERERERERARALGIMGRADDGDFNEAVLAMLRATNERGNAGMGVTTRNEVDDLVRILDAVEQRATRLKGILNSSVGGQGSVVHDHLD